MATTTTLVNGKIRNVFEYKGQRMIVGQEAYKGFFRFNTICLECKHESESYCTPDSKRGQEVLEQAIVWEWCSNCSNHVRQVHFWVY